MHCACRGVRGGQCSTTALESAAAMSPQVYGRRRQAGGGKGPSSQLKFSAKAKRAFIAAGQVCAHWACRKMVNS